MLKVDNRGTKTMPMTSCWCLYCFYYVLVSLLLTSKYFLPFSSVSIVEFQQVNACWLIKVAFHETQNEKEFRSIIESTIKTNTK